ncbi:ATP synthase F1 subunit delta [Neolewinella lacunae]|uniref:ATP synthase subunit delta n=1 Tax=Neolewinella lacunae TaxID=1517758 RepID=A0A923PKY7_9BACT|nr:ATP synthase F1 subunit delta [Neolewinella lacunae]MBC6993199.1 ATP synthase F1 subunit delta [Neolewinella lacunae]MDN3637118.1 ATP synthase F1 subunit delta [Neolewinella lacunae]
MTNHSVAQRYAKSLLDLAVEQKQLDVVKADVDALLEMSGSRELRLLLDSPVVNATRKRAIMEEILTKAGANDLTKSFVKVLITKGREGDLVGILGGFNDQYKHLKKITTVKVTSAVALGQDALASIKQQLIAAGKTEASIDLKTAIDPSILGGFILEFDGKVYDASVVHQLNKYRKELA